MANGWEVRIPYIVEAEGDDGRDWERRSLARLLWRCGVVMQSWVIQQIGLLAWVESVTRTWPVTGWAVSISYLNRY
jgi:hypothetical protein